MSRYLRYLRIAFSAVCGITCLLLIALWVRSYFAIDLVYGPIFTIGEFAVASGDGELGIHYYPTNAMPWGADSLSPDDAPNIEPYAAVLGFSLYQDATNGAYGVGVSYWFLILATAAMAAATWATGRWHFILRTLLIAIALIVAGLGLIVAMAR